MSKTTFHLREKAWVNFFPVYLGYNTQDEEDMIFFPRFMSGMCHAWWWLWGKVFSSDVVIITGDMKCSVIVTFNEEGVVCGLEL